MSDNSAIEWTDATWNPVRGCTKVSPGCANCYAETFAERFRGVKGHPYEQGFDLRLVPEKLEEPLHWKKPKRIFVNSMSDLFQEGVPDEFIASVFSVMDGARQHTFQLLTKRPDRMAAFLNTVYPRHAVARDPNWPRFHHWPLPNVWLGVSVENRHFKSRIDDLRETPAALLFLSIEPLLEDVGVLDLRGIGWVIVGGESGHGARPFRVQWARAILAQCRAAGVPCFVKQLGSHLVDDDIPGPRINPETGGRILTVRQTLTIRNRKGGDPSEWPEDLRVREFPEARQ